MSGNVLARRVRPPTRLAPETTRDTANKATPDGLLSLLSTPFFPSPASCLAFTRARTSARTAATLLVAILVNHVRRLLTPVGRFVLLPRPWEGMKLARSSPHHYLFLLLGGDTGGWSWSWGIAWWLLREVVVWAALTWVRDCGGGARETRLRKGGARETKLQKGGPTNARETKLQKGSPMNARLGEGGTTNTRPGMDYATGGRPGRLEEAGDVAGVVMSLLRFERTYAQMCWLFATIYASASILFPGEDTYEADLVAALVARRPQLLTQALFAAHLVWTVVIPAVAAVRASLGRGLLLLTAYAAVWLGTAYFVRFSNKFFVLLEMGDVVVVAGYAVVATGVLGLKRNPYRAMDGKQRGN